MKLRIGQLATTIALVLAASTAVAQTTPADTTDKNPARTEFTVQNSGSVHGTVKAGAIGDKSGVTAGKADNQASFKTTSEGPQRTAATCDGQNPASRHCAVSAAKLDDKNAK